MPEQYNQRQYLQALQWYFIQQSIRVSKKEDDTDNIIDTDNNDLVDINGNKILATEVT